MIPFITVGAAPGREANRAPRFGRGILRSSYNCQTGCLLPPPLSFLERSDDPLILFVLSLEGIPYNGSTEQLTVQTWHNIHLPARSRSEPIQTGSVCPERADTIHSVCPDRTPDKIAGVRPGDKNKPRPSRSTWLPQVGQQVTVSDSEPGPSIKSHLSLMLLVDKANSNIHSSIRTHQVVCKMKNYAHSNHSLLTHNVNMANCLCGQVSLEFIPCDS
ncbi:unnamed protein product [Nezara viridula]|uniref:Uncharacterized protein n=1 Tax=Nezara viridula TaxID=85310 RepID=A0A9P0HNZ1_NEZVI|nr:unnamed protein product [Nezara viridula]